MFEGGTLQGVIGGLMSESIEDIYLRTMWLVLHTIRICLLVGAHLVTIQASYGCVIAWINCCESWGFFWGGGISMQFVLHSAFDFLMGLWAVRCLMQPHPKPQEPPS